MIRKKPQMGPAPQLVTLEEQNKFLASLRRIPNIEIACQESGVTRKRISKLYKKCREFQLRMEKSMLIGVERIERLAWKRAKQSLDDSPIWQQIVALQSAPDPGGSDDASLSRN